MSKDGGPAFPVPMFTHPADSHLTSGHDGYGLGGMTLRDYFAGMVLNGFSANAKLMIAGNDHSKQLNITADEYLAKYCYACADAMLIERVK